MRFIMFTKAPKCKNVKNVKKKKKKNLKISQIFKQFIDLLIKESHDLIVIQN